MTTDLRLEAVVETCRMARLAEIAESTTEDDLSAIGATVSQLAAAVWADPVTTFDDVIARALVAHAIADKAPDGELLIEGTCEQTRAAVELIRAVLVYAGQMGADTE